MAYKLQVNCQNIIQKSTGQAKVVVSKSGGTITCDQIIAKFSLFCVVADLPAQTVDGRFVMQLLDKNGSVVSEKSIDGSIGGIISGNPDYSLSAAMYAGASATSSANASAEEFSDVDSDRTVLAQNSYNCAAAEFSTGTIRIKFSGFVPLVVGLNLNVLTVAVTASFENASGTGSSGLMLMEKKAGGLMQLDIPFSSIVV